MTPTIIFATIFLCAFVIIGGVVMFLSKTIDAGEARFDSDTGKVKNDTAIQPSEAMPATRKNKTDQEGNLEATP